MDVSISVSNTPENKYIVRVSSKRPTGVFDSEVKAMAAQEALLHVIYQNNPRANIDPDIEVTAINEETDEPTEVRFSIRIESWESYPSWNEAQKAGFELEKLIRRTLTGN